MIPTSLEDLQNLTLDGFVKFFYFNAILITTTLNAFPPVTKKLYAYGKNTSDVQPGSSHVSKSKDPAGPANPSSSPSTEKNETKPRVFDALLSIFGKLQVPHSWFTHFYAFSLAIQLFWLVQIFSRGRILQLVLDIFPNVTSNNGTIPKDGSSKPTVLEGPTGNQSFETILLCIMCMSMQSARRLYEAVYVQKAGDSKMGIMIYIAGILHYTMMGFATWCEGVCTSSSLPFLPYPSYSTPSDIYPIASDINCEEYFSYYSYQRQPSDLPPFRLSQTPPHKHSHRPPHLLHRFGSSKRRSYPPRFVG
ncbi:hypothetical protein ABW19_dt0202269 [Dactylella cylindrospora]|nr:hypothetical protein ABW19_dt0202269 [Dactylella cylindrospora]